MGGTEIWSGPWTNIVVLTLGGGAPGPKAKDNEAEGQTDPSRDEEENEKEDGTETRNMTGAVCRPGLCVHFSQRNLFL